MINVIVPFAVYTLCNKHEALSVVSSGSENTHIAILEASLAASSSPLQGREKLYLLAVGYYKTVEYSRNRQLVEKFLKVCLCSFTLFYLKIDS
ncbi:hypothetical protein DITRI_Ditri10aG0089600 [Diplodiscus trichospermus]